ncbi:MAG: DHH family phosphoesterase [Anaerolineae bacterium]|nr:DHH family phosphoesterase [Anaerolineae bacterium]
MAVRTTKSQLDTLLQLFAGSTHALVLTHNDPDPDALASAYGLATLLRAHRRKGQHINVAYGGTLMRPENKALARYIPVRFRRSGSLDFTAYDFVALVDTQPAQGNHSLPVDMIPSVVLDHHPRLLQTSNVLFVDVRPSYGAASTIVWEYLQVAGITLARTLATALFYGIRSDTLDLTREASDADKEAYQELLMYVDQVALARIQQAPLSKSDYRALAQALIRTELYGYLAIAAVDDVHRPDMAAELADLLIRMEGIKWVLVMATYGDTLILSVRTLDTDQNAGHLIRKAVGDRGSAGGHDTMAAGRIPLAGHDAAAEIQRLRERMIELTKAPAQGQKLIADL